MKIAAMTFRLHAPWVHSLKEKRMIVKSLIAKLQNKFHVSAADSIWIIANLLFIVLLSAEEYFRLLITPLYLPMLLRHRT